VYYEVFADIENAIQREKRIKGILRRKKFGSLKVLTRDGRIYMKS